MLEGNEVIFFVGIYILFLIVRVKFEWYIKSVLINILINIKSRIIYDILNVYMLVVLKL